MADATGISKSAVPPPLESVQHPASPAEALQALHRSVLRREGPRYRRALPQPARPRDGALRGREEPATGAGANGSPCCLLPLGLGYVEGVAHGYIRHGTTTPFAALDVATGRVLAQCKARHRHQEFLSFLRHIDANVPPGLDPGSEPIPSRYPTISIRKYTPSGILGRLRFSAIELPANLFREVVEIVFVHQSVQRAIERGCPTPGSPWPPRTTPAVAPLRRLPIAIAGLLGGSLLYPPRGPQKNETQERPGDGDPPPLGISGGSTGTPEKGGLSVPPTRTLTARMAPVIFALTAATGTPRLNKMNNGSPNPAYSVSAKRFGDIVR